MEQFFGWRTHDGDAVDSLPSVVDAVDKIGYEIVQIWENQNPELWTAYKSKKNELKLAVSHPTDGAPEAVTDLQQLASSLNEPIFRMRSEKSSAGAARAGCSVEQFLISKLRSPLWKC